MPELCPLCDILVCLSGEKPDEDVVRAVLEFPVRLLREPRRGVSLARNLCVGQAHGEILVFLDDDVVCHHTWLHNLLQGFEDPLVACVTGQVLADGPGYGFLDGEPAFRNTDIKQRCRTLDASVPGWFHTALSGRIGAGCNMAFRKSFLAKNPFPEELGAGSLIGGSDEAWLFVQVMKRGLRIQHVPSAVVTHHFERNPERHKARVLELHAASVALALKVLWEEPELRKSTLKIIFKSATKRLRNVFRKDRETQPSERLSRFEAGVAYLGGILNFCKSRLRVTRG